MFGILGVPASRCASCGHGFSSAEHERVLTDSARAKAVSATFLRPEDDRAFQDVLRDLTRDEEKSTSGADCGDHAGDSHKRAKVLGMHPASSDGRRGTSGMSGNE